MVVVRPLYRDTFNPLLVSSPPIVLTNEQLVYIRAVLDVSSSDSKFAEKAYTAIVKILTGGSVVVPVVTSLTPNSAVIGSASFTLHVRGTGFKAGSIIVFAGVEEPTTHVSDTELTTGVDMSVWLGPDTIPVLVKSPDGVLSAPSNFVFMPASAVQTTTPPPPPPTSSPSTTSAPTANVSTAKVEGKK
jgi:hypothetical protein